MAHYNELLKLCAFDEAEIKSQKKRIERALEILGLGPADTARAVERVQKYFDIELMGVRKLLRLWLKETFDLVLAREEGKKIIYFGYPPFQCLGLVIKAGTKSKDDFFITCPESTLCHSLGQIFGKLEPVLEAGEASGLPPGHAMCAFLQIRLGALEKGIIPIPDMCIATSYYCDMGPKADELMQHKYGYPVEYIDTCLDAPWGLWPKYDLKTTQYLGTNLNNAFNSLNHTFRLEINDDAWKEAESVGMKFYEPMNEVNEYIAADPVPLRAADAELIMCIPMGCTGVGMEEGPEALKILAGELKKRVEKGIGVLPKGTPRVMNILQNLSDPAINRLMEEVGLAVAASVVQLPPPFEPPPEEYVSATIGEKRAEKAMFGAFYHSSYAVLRRMAESLKFAHNVDGIIYNYHFACRPLVTIANVLKLYLEKETGLPVLLLDMDYYDARNYSAASLRTRLEAFAEMLKAKRAVA